MSWLDKLKDSVSYGTGGHGAGSCQCCRKEPAVGTRMINGSPTRVGKTCKISLDAANPYDKPKNVLKMEEDKKRREAERQEKKAIERAEKGS